MSYLTLVEAAEYARHKKGVEIEEDAILRAGIHGAILITAPFSGFMQNLISHEREEYAGLLVIPTKHLLEMETNGQTKITAAFGLDGKVAFSPHVVRTREQLRVLISELERFTNGLRGPQTEGPAPERNTALLKQAGEWVGKARQRAGEIIERQRAKDLYPSQIDIADEIAKEFRAAGILGAEGKPLSGGYIKRQALKGITSAVIKQLSTQTGQSKRSK